MTNAAANTQQPAAKAEPLKNTHFATLVRGEFYSLGNVVFKPGKPVPVPAYIKEHLELHAVDRVDVEGENEDRQKFDFQEIVEGQAPAARRVRGRGRAAAEQTDESDE